MTNPDCTWFYNSEIQCLMQNDFLEFCPGPQYLINDVCAHNKELETPWKKNTPEIYLDYQIIAPIGLLTLSSKYGQKLVR